MKQLALLVAVGAMLATQASVSALIPEQVRVETGLLAGTAAATPNVRIFKGIPFAAPPLGENRWKAPQPAAKWEGVRKADAFGNRCIAGGGGGGRGRGGSAGGCTGRGNAQPLRQLPAAPPAAPAQPPASEDCLYVNVWTSANAATDRRPVMVWIYGGGFTGGAGSEQRYDGERLAAKGPVVVTFNYRLGVFGFFAHPELAKESGHNASGNYGMMDAIAALQWVKRNIGAFGGDPNNVTVFGESAGAIMTSALVGSPQAKGLFKRAITQSGAWMGLQMARMTTRSAAREQAGAKAMPDMGVASIADLRAQVHRGDRAGLRAPAGLVDRRLPDSRGSVGHVRATASRTTWMCWPGQRGRARSSSSAAATARGAVPAVSTPSRRYRRARRRVPEAVSRRKRCRGERVVPGCLRRRDVMEHAAVGGGADASGARRATCTTSRVCRAEPTARRRRAVRRTRRKFSTRSTIRPD